MLRQQAIEAVKKTLSGDERVVFAYLHGSLLEGDGSQAKDIDIAVFSARSDDTFSLAGDLKIALYQNSGIPSDFFDVRIINDILDTGDLFALLYLKSVLMKNLILVDRVPDIRSSFLERYGMKYRECEGLIDEVLL